jgi:tetratricopeptide (TPR) repeat protein
VTNIVRFFTERATTASYPALLAWWLALPGQTGDGGLPLALLLAAFAVAFLILLLPATRAILLPAVWAMLPSWIQQHFIWTPNERDPGYPRTGTTRAIRAVLYGAWAVLVAPTIVNYGPSLLALVTSGTAPTAENIIRALKQGIFLTLSPRAGLIVFAIEVTLTLAAAAALVDWRVEERLEQRHARPTPPQEEYGLLPVSTMPVDAIQLTEYVPDVYLPQHDEDTGEDARALTIGALRLAAKRDPGAPVSSQTPIGVCIAGKPMEGKTRLAWEALHAALDDVRPEWTFLLWRRTPTYSFDLGAHAGKRFALWLDDLQKYAANPVEVSRLQQLLLDLRKARAPVIVVATCRDGREGEPARARFADLFAQLRIIQPQDLTPEQTAQLQADLRSRSVPVYEGDGTPGSVLFSVTSMRERYELMSQSAEVGGSGARGADAQRLLKAMKLLQSAGSYDFPLARVRAVAIGRFNLGPTPGAFKDAADLLESEGFVRLRPGESEESGRLEPVADVYLDQAIPDYPGAGHRMSEDWPLLRDVLRSAGDADALNNLGAAFAELKEGYATGLPHDLLGNKNAAIVVYEAALLALSREKSPAEWAIVKSNIGAMLTETADLMIDDAPLQARLCGEALDAYDEAIRTKPDFATAYYNKGNALDALKRYEEALDAYDEAIRLQPDFAIAHYNMGAILYKRFQRFDKALAAFDEVIRIRPDYASAYSNKGAALGALGRRDEALAAIEEAIRLNPNDATAYSNKGVALGKLERYEDALVAYQDALRLAPEDASIWSAMADLLSGRLQRVADALSAAERAVALDASSIQGWRVLGDTLHTQRRESEAQAAYERALALEATDASDWFNRGLALAGSAHFDEALAAYDHALNLEPGDDEVLHAKATALRALGRRAEAEEADARAAARRSR